MRFRQKILIWEVASFFNAAMCLSKNSSYIEQVTRRFMRACGPKSFCNPDLHSNFMVPHIDSKYCSPCPICFCDDWCRELGDCCIDLQINNSYWGGNVKVPTPYRCIKSTPWKQRLSKNIWDLGSVPLLNECHNSSNPELSYRCNYPDKKHPLELLPVTSISTGLSYRNMFCFECLGATEPLAWDIVVRGCTQMPPYNLLSFFEEILQIAKKLKCEVSLEPSADLPFRRQCRYGVPRGTICEYDPYSPNLLWSCMHPPANINSSNDLNHTIEHTVDTCNQTGLWKVYDETLNEGCQYGDIDTLMVSSFKNIHCLLCNTDPNTGTRCSREEYFEPHDGFVFNINSVFGSTHKTKKTNGSCDTGGSSDELPCRDIFCPRGQHFENNTCKMILRKRNVEFAYTLFFRLTSVENIERKLVCDLLLEIVTTVTSTLRGEITKLVHDKDTFVHIGGVNAFVIPNIDDGTLAMTNIDMSDLSSGDVMILMNISTIPSAEKLSLEKLLLGFRELTFEVKTEYIFQASIDDRSYELSQLGDFNGMAVCSKQSSYNIEKLIPHQVVGNILICQQVELGQDEFEIINNSRIYIPLLGINLGISNYIIINEKARICVNDYVSTPTPKMQGYIRENIYSIGVTVCSCASLFCVLLTLVTYWSIYPKLRNSTGILNMFLFIILFAATSMILVSSRIEARETQCVVVGAVMHYIWLLYYVCMNTCFVHLYIQRYTINERTREHTLLKYIYAIYITTVPAAVVGITVMVKMEVSGHSGYSSNGHICLIGELTTYIFAFVLPQFIFAAISSSMYVLSFRHYRYYSPRGADSMDGTICAQQHQMKCLLKLVFLTNFTCLLQIIDAIMDYTGNKNSIFALATIILNTLHGVLVFFAFTFNIQTFKSYRERMAEITKSRSKTTSSNLNESDLRETDHCNVERTPPNSINYPVI